MGRLQKLRAFASPRYNRYNAAETMTKPAAAIIAVICALAVSFAVATAHVVATPDDRDALIALYDATDGASWTNADNWLTDRPLNEWHGVGVDDAGRVARLQLPDNNLNGELPSALG